MKNSFGNSLTVTLFGESHGEYIGAVLDGLAPGIKIDEEYIRAKLALRRPAGSISTTRVETDEYRIISGVFNGYTTGTPLCILIPNENKKSEDYGERMDIPRPSHADYTASVKYHGFEDFRGGGHFSGRLTAAVVAAGAIVQAALETKGIKIGSHITELHGAFDRHFEDYESDIALLASKSFPTLDDEAKMIKEIEKAGGVDFSRPVLMGYTGLSDVLLVKYIEDSRHLWEGGLPEVRYTTIGSVIGTHAGPGAYAFAFFWLIALWLLILWMTASFYRARALISLFPLRTSAALPGI